MTTARAAAPNLGGRANTRSRAVVANFGASNVLDFAASSESTAVGAAYWPARRTVAPTENSANRPINDTPALKARPARGTGPRPLRVRFGHSWYALPATSGSAQPIAHHGVLPVDSQSPTFTAAIRQSGAACLLGDFYLPASVGYSACDGKQRTTDQMPAWPGDTGAEFFAAPIHDANPAQVAHEHAGISCEVVIAARERLEPVAQWNGVTVGRDRRDFNGRNAQVDAQEGNRCNMRPELRAEVTTTRSLTGTTPVMPEIDTGPSTFFQGVEGFADAWRQGLGAGMHRGRLTVPRVSATRREVHASGRFESGNVHHFTAPPRTTTRASGNYGNGWRNFNAAAQVTDKA